MEGLLGPFVFQCRRDAWRMAPLWTTFLVCLLYAQWGFAGTALLAQETRVNSSGDDAEQELGGQFTRTSSDLELVFDKDLQVVGIRFEDIDVPRGALVSDAWIQFTVDEASTDISELYINGEATDNSVGFSNADDVTSRTPTDTSVAWDPDAWENVGEAGTDQRTSDIAAVIQEIVDRPGWQQGNALTMLISGSGKRVAESWDGDDEAGPLLHVEYFVWIQEAPTVDAGGDQTIMQPSHAVLDGSVVDDGLPFPPGTTSVVWSQESGPGSVVFADPTAIDTTASFSAAGVYVLRLSADDGQDVSFNELEISVDIAPAPPQLISLSPPSAQVAMVVTIGGTNLVAVESVSFDGVEAQFREVDDQTIVATVPSGAGSGPVTVSTALGDSASVASFIVLASPPVLVGAGDIAECPDQGEETAVLLDGIAGTVFAAGDNVYEDATVDDFANCYEPTWGRHKSRTRPVPGNHDYYSTDAAPYYDYFGAAAGEPDKGYYSYDVGDWHVVALNSECGEVGGCDRDSPQGKWLRQDLLKNPALCTAAVWHHPRFSSGIHGNDERLNDFWEILYAAGAEVILNGHAHNYERYAPQSPDAVADPLGIRQLIVGTGGVDLRDIEVLQPNSEVFDSDSHGVLKLALNSTGYEWEFIPVAGDTFTDSGTATCNAVDQPPYIDAGSDQTVIWGEGMVLEATALDDGFPSVPPTSFSYGWSQVSGPGTATFSDSSALNSAVSFSQAGRYVLRLFGYDGVYFVNDEITVLVIPSGTEVVDTEEEIDISEDDAEESAITGAMYLDSTDLELVYDDGAVGGDQIVGLRFDGVDIPQGATVLGAYIQFQVDEVSSDFTSLLIQGEAVANSADFTSANSDLSERERTLSSVTWAPAEWVAVGDDGLAQRTPDISAIIQEIVDQPNWVIKNELSIFITGSGRRVAESWDGDPAGAPKLVLRHSEPVSPGPLPPWVNIEFPSDRKTCIAGNTYQFRASALDDKDGDLSANLIWNSNLDGLLGMGVDFLSDLSLGTHTVTAVVSDSDGMVGEDYVVVACNETCHP